MTLKESIGTYLDARTIKLVGNTANVYKGNLTRFANWIGEKKLLGDIVDEEIFAFLKLISKNNKKSTTQNYAGSLRPFFKWWAIKGKCEVHWQLIEGPKVDEFYRPHVREEDFRLMDQYLSENSEISLVKRLIVNLLWDTGMRINELLALDLSQIENGKYSMRIVTEKNNKNRYIVWSKHTTQLLRRYLGIRLCIATETDALFITPKSGRRRGVCTRLTARAVQRWVREICNDLGIEQHLTPHSFRHGKAHYILNNGGNTEHVMFVLGHLSPDSSRKYLRLNEQEQIKVASPFLQQWPKERNIEL